MDFRDYDTRLASYCVVVNDADELLLALWHEPDPPLWTLPGGGVELEESVEEGAVRPVIDSVFALRDAAEAFRRLESRRARGKVVLRVE